MTGLHMREFEGRLDRIETLVLTSAAGRQLILRNKITSVTLRRQPSQISSGGTTFTVTPIPVLGQMSITARHGAELSIDPSAGSPALSIETTASQRATVHVEAEKILLEANRAVADSLAGPAPFLRHEDSFRLRIANEIAMTTADFTSSGVHQDGDPSILTVAYPGTRDSIPIQSVRSDSFNASLASSPLRLDSCSMATMSFDGQQMPPLSRAPRFSLVAQGSGLRITGLKLKREQADRDSPWTLAVALSGRATQLLADERELLPSQLRELREEPLDRKSLYALALGLVLTLGTALLKRSLHLLAALIIPDPKE